MTSRVLLDRLLAHRIVILDGAMGTMIQSQGFDGVPDLAVLDRPDTVRDIHAGYLDAGADIIRTNTFSSTSIGQPERRPASFVYELNLKGARLARAVADKWSRKISGQPRFVAGTIGPSKEVSVAYREQVRGLLDGGVDVLLIETVFDWTNARAAIAGVVDELTSRAVDVPVMISATTTTRGEHAGTLAAFHESIHDARPFSVGLNCSNGVTGMGPLLRELSKVATSYISCHPSAGLPNAQGDYNDSPAEMANQMRELAAAGLLNIAGGCCGTTPEHIRAIAEAVRNIPPRAIAG